MSQICSTWVVVLVLAAPSEARANDAIDQARRHYDDAAFDAALGALVRAESAGGLRRDDVVDLLELRALVEFATGAMTEVDADLARLASLEPEHRLAAEAPPELQQRFEAVRRRIQGRLAVRAAATRDARGWRVRAEVLRDTTQLVRRLEISAREAGRAWRRADANELRVDAPRARRIEYRAVAYGPGGAPVAEAGTEESPLVAAEVFPADLGEPDPDHDQDRDQGDGPGIAIWIGLGAAVVVAAVVVILLVSSSGGQSETTLLGGPMRVPPGD